LFPWHRQAEERRPPAERARFADAVLTAAVLFCLSVAGYYVYFYDWLHQRDFTAFTGRILYEFLPAALGVLFIVSLRLKPASKINLALVLGSTGISIYLAEFVLPPSSTSILWFNSKPAWEKKKIAEKFGVDFDTRSRLHVITDLRRNGFDAVPATVPSLLLRQQQDGQLKSGININGTEALPLGGISNKVTVLCNEAGEYTIFDSDEHGFANPKKIWNSGRVDIAAVGDSFTQGFCVPHDKTFVAVLRKRYPATLNLGGGGNGPLLELATLKEYAAPIKAKTVLWFYFEDNDLRDLKREKNAPLLMRYLTTKGFRQGLLRQQTVIDRTLAVYIEKAEIEAAEKAKDLYDLTERDPKIGWLSWFNARIKLIHLRHTLGLVYGTAASQQATEAEIDLLHEILREAKASVNGWGGSLYFVYLPGWTRYGNVAFTEKHREHILSIVKNLGLPLVDIDSTFRAWRDPLALFPFRQPAHYNVEGNRLVADAVLRAIGT
jgi:hypothetical protein